MLKQNDEVSVFRSGKTYSGRVLGSEGDLFWLLVLGLNEVYRGHQMNIFEYQGVKCLGAEEWSHEVEQMFDANGQFCSDAFWHSQNPEPMIQQLKVYYLLNIIRRRAT